MKAKTGRGSKRSLTLAIEGATYLSSVALLADSEVIAERSIRPDEASSARSGERVMPAIA